MIELLDQWSGTYREAGKTRSRFAPKRDPMSFAVEAQQDGKWHLIGDIPQGEFLHRQFPDEGCRV